MILNNLYNYHFNGHTADVHHHLLNRLPIVRHLVAAIFHSFKLERTFLYKLLI